MRINYEKHLALDAQKNPKKFYRYANFRSGKAKTPKTMLDDQEKLIDNSTDILELFGDYFASVFSEPCP